MDPDCFHTLSCISRKLFGVSTNSLQNSGTAFCKQSEDIQMQDLKKFWKNPRVSKKPYCSVCFRSFTDVYKLLLMSQFSQIHHGCIVSQPALFLLGVCRAKAWHSLIRHSIGWTMRAFSRLCIVGFHMAYNCVLGTFSFVVT